MQLLNCGRQSATSVTVGKGRPGKPVLVAAFCERDQQEFKSSLMGKGYGIERSELSN